MKIDLTDAAFAVKYGFDLIENDKCFSAVTSGVGNTERYREFMESNEKERYRGIVNYYLDGIQEDYRRQRASLPETRSIICYSGWATTRMW